MPYAVGSKDFFTHRNTERQFVEDINLKAATIYTESDEDLTWRALVVLIGQAFRSLIEFFDDNRYENKLKKRISVLTTTDDGNYCNRIKQFHSEYIEDLRAKAFLHFRDGLNGFNKIVSRLLERSAIQSNGEPFEKLYPDLHKSLKTIYGDEKRAACKALKGMKELLDSIVIEQPKTLVDILVLELKEKFDRDTLPYLNENLSDLKEGLTLKKKDDFDFTVDPKQVNKLHKFLDKEEASFLSLIPELNRWKKAMIDERVATTGALPYVTDSFDRFFYSFLSKQISLVKRIIKLQSEEINTEDKLQQSFVNFLYDKMEAQIEQDKEEIAKCKGLRHLYDGKKEHNRLNKQKCEEQLKALQETPENMSEIQEKLEAIQTKENNYAEYSRIADASYQKWVEDIEKLFASENEAFIKLKQQGEMELDELARLYFTLFQYPTAAKAACDMARLEIDYSLKFKEKDPNSPRFLELIKPLQKDCQRLKSFKEPLSKDWETKALPLVETILSEVNALLPKEEEPPKLEPKMSDSEIAKENSLKDIIPTEEDFKKEEQFFDSLKNEFTRKKVLDDGSCFFHACALGIKAQKGIPSKTFEGLQTMDGYKLREALYAYIRENFDSFGANLGRILTSDINAFVSLENTNERDAALLKVAPGLHDFYLQCLIDYQNLPKDLQGDYSTQLERKVLSDTTAFNLYVDAMAADPKTFVDNFELEVFTSMTGLSLAIHTLGYPGLSLKIEAPANLGVIHLYRPSTSLHYDYLEPKTA